MNIKDIYKYIIIAIKDIKYSNVHNTRFHKYPQTRKVNIQWISISTSIGYLCVYYVYILNIRYLLNFPRRYLINVPRISTQYTG